MSGSSETNDRVASHLVRLELAAILERAQPEDAAYVREVLDQLPAV
jgi:hypothetical protein